MTAENAVANYGLAYEYDANGNITAEYAVHADNSHTLRYRYTYDEANQLTRVDDNVRGKTFVYQYDKGGNRVSEKIYAYTLSNSLGAVQQTNESKYTFLTWKDRLSSYNNKSITYDNAGNPKQYGDTTYVWAGKQLVEIRPGDGSKTQFEYDADGLRTQKRQYGTDGRLEYFVDYVWQNGKLTQQILTLMGYRSDGSAFKIGPLNTKFVYDGNSDQPTACFVGEQQMLFVRNLQGDILAVATSDGEVVAEFSYDAWGNVEYTIPDGVDETWEAFIPLFCPLTYRGYNYDFTTGLYYLQSRYYNPEWGRFMNVDDTSILLATQGETHNANLFAYCCNNPVNQVDYTGYWKADIHKQMTYSVGSSFFTDYAAQELAEADAATDSLFSPFPPFNHPLEGSWHWIQNQSIHFNRNPPELADSRLVYALIMLVVAAKNWATAEFSFANSPKNSSERWLLSCRYEDSLKYLGYGLHAYQDIEAHGNIGAENYIAQHIVSSNGRYIHKADDINYSWTDDSKTALKYDPNLTRYYHSMAMTRIYLEAFRDLVYMYRNDYNIHVTKSPLF